MKKKGPEFENNLKVALRKDSIYLVPVPWKGVPEDQNWKMDFSQMESKLISGGNAGSIKKAIRCLKFFRNSNQEMEKVKSYFLKCVVMNMVKNDPTNKWQMKDLAANFLQALIDLQEALEKRFLPSFFIPEQNVFENVKPGRFAPIARWIDNAIGDLQDALELDELDCEEEWKSYFGKYIICRYKS